jgi:hypothetical protein
VNINIGANELTALDVVGYNMMTPEPGSIGFAAIGACVWMLRRGRKKPAV